jgi:predicted transcriptional regulator
LIAEQLFRCCLECGLIRGILSAMDKQTITFRADRKRVKALDRLARSLDRDRSYILNEAVEQYLSVHQYHLEQIEKGVDEARAGKLIDYDNVKADWLKRLDQ